MDYYTSVIYIELKESIKPHAPVN